MKTIALVCLLSCFSICAQEIITNGHAHNDYEHELPLLEALSYGFISVEVDVHYVDGHFWVSHDLPKSTEGLKTIQELYLNPLLERINQNKGAVYRNYDDFFYLMIDVKTDAAISYRPLRKVLSQYASIISVVSDSIDQFEKPVKVFISGHHGRPYPQLLNDSIKFAGLDGRPEELGLGMPTAYMPVISQRYDRYLSWNGEGKPNDLELAELKKMVDRAHLEDKKVRLWASPEKDEVWQLLLDLGIDLINTDQLDGFNKYISKHKIVTENK